MRSKGRMLRDSLNTGIENTYKKLRARKSAKKRLKLLDGGYSCDKEYQEIVLPYWEKFGYKPAKMWYELYSAHTKTVDPRVIPDDLFYGEILPYFSNTQFRRFAEDKCYHDVWLGEVKRPDTICKNIAGVFYNADMEMIDCDTAVDLCLSYSGEFLLKPSIDTGEGRLIQFFDPANLHASQLKAAFSDLGANFICQAAVKQSSVLSELNPSSINTIRPITMLFKGQVHLLSAVLRVGAPGKRVDNYGAGGCSVPILESGLLGPEAVFKDFTWTEVAPTGVVFKDFEVPAYDRIIDLCKQLHPKFPHFKIIGWDFAVDSEGDPVLIEYNTFPGDNQVECGATFAHLTDEVLEEFFITRSLEHAQN